jgi:hypothetical protein
MPLILSQAVREPANSNPRGPLPYRLVTSALQETHCVSFNPLKPSGNFSTTRFNIHKLYVVPTLRLCVLYGSQNKQQLLPYKTLRDWFL